MEKQQYEVWCANHKQIAIITSAFLGFQMLGDHMGLSPDCTHVEVTPYKNKIDSWLKHRKPFLKQDKWQQAPRGRRERGR